MNMLISRRMKKCVAWIMAVVMLTGDILLNSVTDPDTPWDTWSSSTEGLNSWNSIGEYKSADDNRPFAGTFDGEGHTVSGLWTCTRTRTTNGLFGYSTGVIKNVNVEKSYIEGSGYGVGGIVNCYNQGNVTVSQNGGYCGTVAGALERAGFDSCGKVSYSYWKNDISPSEPVGYTGEGTFTEATCRKYSSDYTLYTVLDAETGVDFTIDVSSETADRLADALDKWTQAKNCGSKEVGIARWTAGSGGPVFASEAADTWNGNAAAILDGKMTLTWDAVAGAAGYRIYRSDTAGSYGERIDDVRGNSYLDVSVDSYMPGEYYYYVRAYVEDEDGVYYKAYSEPCRAEFEKVKLTYRPNGGQGDIIEDYVIMGSSDIQVRDCTYTRKGYRFTGWYGTINDTEISYKTDIDEQGNNDSISAEVIDVTFEECKIAYIANNMTEDKVVVEYIAGADVTVIQNTFMYSGRTFVSWNTDPLGKGYEYVPGNNYRVESDLTLYAVWKLDKPANVVAAVNDAGTEIELDTPYYYYVVAYIMDSANDTYILGDYSEGLLVMITSSPAPSPSPTPLPTATPNPYGKVTNLTAESVEEGVINLKWDDMDNVTGFRVYNVDNNAGDNMTLCRDVSGCSLTISNLEEGRTYYYCVRGYQAKVGVGFIYSNMPDIVSVKVKGTLVTTPEPTPGSTVTPTVTPSPASNLTSGPTAAPTGTPEATASPRSVPDLRVNRFLVKDAYGKYINLIWDKNDNAAGYEISYSTTIDGVRNVVAVCDGNTTSLQSVEVTGAAFTVNENINAGSIQAYNQYENAVYYYYIRAIYSEGFAEYSAPILIQLHVFDYNTPTPAPSVTASPEPSLGADSVVAAF